MAKFEKGQGGRRKGSKNKITATSRERNQFAKKAMGDVRERETELREAVGR